jgi:hypothetical protein
MSSRLLDSGGGVPATRTMCNEDAFDRRRPDEDQESDRDRTHPR